MPIDGQSFYSEDFYGSGFYSWEPLVPGVIELQADSNIRFYSTSKLIVVHPIASYHSFGFISDAPLFLITNIASESVILFYSVSRLSFVLSITSDDYFALYATSNEWIGPFWQSWHPVIPDGDMVWSPDVPINGGWTELVPSHGPWIPIGPDTTPNPGY